MTDLIVDHFEPERIIRFGSQARGDTDRDGDVDLLVVMAGTVDRRETAVQIRRVLRNIPVAKDIVTWYEEVATRARHRQSASAGAARRDGAVPAVMRS